MIAFAGSFPPWLAPDAWAVLLLDLTLKGSVLLALAGLCALLTRRRAASLRHWLWSLAFCGLLLLPAANRALPSLRVPALVFLAEEDRSPRERVVETLLPPLVGRPGASQSEPEPSAPGAPDPAGPPVWPALLVVIWLGGAALLAVRLLADLLRLHRYSLTARPLSSPEWRLFFAQCAAEAGVRRPVRFKLSRHVQTPMTFGVFRPVVLLPHAFAAWSMSRWRAVLLHELAHVRRLDFLTNLLSLGVCALHWHNPFVWFAARMLRIERERASDDCVLRQGLDGVDYAEHLLGVARHLSRVRSSGPSIVAMARASGLGARIRSILDPRAPRQTLNPATGFLTTVLAVVLVAPLAALDPAGAPEDALSDAPALALTRIADLGSESSRAREEAALTLGLARVPEASDALILKLADPSSDVRGVAAWALGRIEDPASVPFLSQLMCDPNLFVREMAVRSLGQIGDPRAASPLAQLVREDNPRLRATIVWALGRIGNRTALEVVTGTLDDADPYVRRVAAHALLQASGEHVACVLRRALSEETSGPARQRIQQILELRRLSVASTAYPLS